MPSPVHLTCCQTAPDIDQRARTAADMRAAVRHALDCGADVVVLPELASCGYAFESSEEARGVAEPRDGETVRSWSAELAGSAAILVGGFCELGDDGRVFNSAAVVGADGLLVVYRKAHLWGREPEFFVAGDGAAPVVETPHGRLGVCICYDLEFPELTRGLALRGADIIVAPTNWPRSTPPPGERSMLVTLAMATACLNGVFVAVCDRTGAERGSEYEGSTVIAGPDGWVLDGPPIDRVNGEVSAQCDIQLARDKRTGRFNDAFADRRVDVYDRLDTRR